MLASAGVIVSDALEDSQRLRWRPVQRHDYGGRRWIDAHCAALRERGVSALA